MRGDWRLATVLLATGVWRMATAQTIAITGGTIYPVSGPRIENGTLLAQDGKIVAVGATVSIPEGATRIDAKGKWITPGLIHGGSTLGLKLFEIGAQEDTEEDTTTGEIKPASAVAV